MLKLLADENFNNDIVRGLRRRSPEIDIVRVQDVGLSGADDPTVLAWAAADDRLLLTHDVGTMTKYANSRTAAGDPMHGIVEVTRRVAVGAAIDDILLLVELSLPDEWEGKILFLPLD